jgi:membrane-bound acyltransferase YfiQ involved in biofilm formation
MSTTTATSSNVFTKNVTQASSERWFLWTTFIILFVILFGYGYAYSNSQLMMVFGLSLLIWLVTGMILPTNWCYVILVILLFFSFGVTVSYPSYSSSSSKKNKNLSSSSDSWLKYLGGKSKSRHRRRYY